MVSSRSVTAYRYVADTLRRQILSGRLAPGECLPPERELCERFGASRITIRRALQILAEEVLIERRQGLGTFVSPVPTRRIPLLNTDFSGSMASHAPDLERALEMHEWRQATADVADALQLPAGASVLFARRLDLLRGTPVAFDEISLPEPMADRLEENDLAQLRFLERWQTVQQIRLIHLSQRIEAVSTKRAHLKFLKAKPGAPLLKETDILFVANGTPCGYFVSYFRHDLFQLTSTVQLGLVSNGDEIGE
jgi:GntR family transcriptional regulator